MKLTQENRSTREETCPNTNLSITIFGKYCLQGTLRSKHKTLCCIFIEISTLVICVPLLGTGNVSLVFAGFIASVIALHSRNINRKI
jgi:hypothetical protein